MLSPGDFVSLGLSVEHECSRIAGGFHAKDDSRDGWLGAAEEAREKTDEVRMLLSYPGLVEKLAGVVTGDALPADAPFQQKRARFEQCYRQLGPAIADALKNLWIGDWEINDDGLVAKLRIFQWQAASEQPGRDLKVEYTRADGTTCVGWVRRFDARWHHLQFFVGFSEGSRDFDAYLFKWDKCKLAGVSGGRGFSAVKVRGVGIDRP